MTDKLNIWELLPGLEPVDKFTAIAVGWRGKMGVSHKLNLIEDDAARYGFYKIRTKESNFAKMAWQIKCANCANVFSAYWGPDTSPALMVKNMHVRKWSVGKGERPLCPDCAHPKKAAPRPKPEAQNFKPWTPPAPLTPIYTALLDASEMKAWKQRVGGLYAERAEAMVDVAVKQAKVAEARAEREKRVREAWEKRKAERSERRRLAREKAERDAAELAARIAAQKKDEEQTMADNSKAPTPTPKITHTVFQMLDSVFDEPKRMYKHGYNDGRVAKECGTTEEVVKYLRGDVYGELAEDPRLASIKEDIELFEMQLDELVKTSRTAIRDLYSRLEQLRVQVAR